MTTSSAPTSITRCGRHVNIVSMWKLLAQQRQQHDDVVSTTARRWQHRHDNVGGVMTLSAPTSITRRWRHINIVSTLKLSAQRCRHDDVVSTTMETSARQHWRRDDIVDAIVNAIVDRTLLSACWHCQHIEVVGTTTLSLWQHNDDDDIGTTTLMAWRHHQHRHRSHIVISMLTCFSTSKSSAQRRQRDDVVITTARWWQCWHDNIDGMTTLLAPMLIMHHHWHVHNVSMMMLTVQRWSSLAR